MQARIISSKDWLSFYNIGKIHPSAPQAKKGSPR